MRRHGDPDGTEHDAEGTQEAGRGRQAHAQRPVTQTRDEPFHAPRRVERPRGQALLQGGMVWSHPRPSGQVLPEFQTLPRLRTQVQGTGVVGTRMDLRKLPQQT